MNPTTTADTPATTTPATTVPAPTTGEPLRVAYLCADPGVPVHGTKGASVHTQEIVRAWRRRGASVRIYCVRTGSDLPADLADVPVVHLPVDQPPTAAKPVEPEDKTARVADRERRQVRIADRLAQAVIRDGADVVYERYSLFSTALAQVSAALRIPNVLEVNAPLIDEQATHRVLVDRTGAERALSLQLSAATCAAAVSEPVAQWLRKRSPQTADKVLVSPNGVDPQRIQPSSPTKEGPPVVLFVGTLKPWHGVEILLEAAALARRPWQLRIVGDGPLGAQLRQQAVRLGLDVDFRGAVPPAQISHHLAGASVGVAPYPPEDPAQPQYFSPLKVYEYGAAGLPVVASRVGQLPQIVREGTTGLLVTPGIGGELGEAIDWLVSHPARATAMGRNARALMVAEHSWDTVLDRIVAHLPDSAQLGHHPGADQRGRWTA